MNHSVQIDRVDGLVDCVIVSCAGSGLSVLDVQIAIENSELPADVRAFVGAESTQWHTDSRGVSFWAPDR
jgi:hypothetical protein